MLQNFLAGIHQLVSYGGSIYMEHGCTCENPLYANIRHCSYSLRETLCMPIEGYPPQEISGDLPSYQMKGHTLISGLLCAKLISPLICLTHRSLMEVHQPKSCKESIQTNIAYLKHHIVQGTHEYTLQSPYLYQIHVCVYIYVRKPFT